MTHGYYVAKARRAFMDAALPGLVDPDQSESLASWAEQQMARERDQRPRGVVVAYDGRLLAETFYSIGATYVRWEDTQRYGITGNELGLALGSIARAEGMDVMHIKLSRFSGASEK